MNKPSVTLKDSEYGPRINWKLVLIEKFREFKREINSWVKHNLFTWSINLPPSKSKRLFHYLFLRNNCSNSSMKQPTLSTRCNNTFYKPEPTFASTIVNQQFIKEGLTVTGKLALDLLHQNSQKSVTPPHTMIYRQQTFTPHCLSVGRTTPSQATRWNISSHVDA